MTVEKLSEYFNSGDSKQSLQRIFIAYQIEQAISKDWKEKVGVTVGEDAVTIRCKSAAQATAFNLRKQKLYALISHYTAGRRYQIKVKVATARS